MKPAIDPVALRREAWKKYAGPPIDPMDTNLWKKISARADGLSVDAKFGEVEREAGYKDGIYTASVTIGEVLRAVRVDTENAALDPIAETAAKLTIEAISRLWYERKGAL